MWKKTEQGVQWDSPWGKGRPGWHTECVVMIQDHFHHMIDIHGGGMDLKFPHHENEVAQSRACFNHALANVWMHNGMLNIDGEKMSKSLGNVMLAKDMIKLIGGNVVRWIMLSAHYRAPINITEEIIETAKIELNKSLSVLKQVEIKSQLVNYSLATDQTSDYYTAFLDAMQDDLNTPNAMKTIFDVIKSINGLIRSKELKDELRVYYQDLLKMLDVLGIKHEVTVLNNHQLDVYKLWNQAKENKDFTLADTYRQELINENVLI